MRFPFLLGRIVFGSFFLYNGIHHFTERRSLSQYAGAKKVPLAGAAVPLSGVALLLGGASILLGIKPKYGAAAIMAFLAGVSPMIHDFWRVEEPGQRMNEMINFSKNLALLGGALVLMGVAEPWPVSVPVARPSRMERIREAVRRVAA